MKQQMKAAAMVKLEATLAAVIPYSLNKSILDVMNSVTLPMCKNVEKEDPEMQALAKDLDSILPLSIVQSFEPVQTLQSQ